MNIIPEDYFKDGSTLLMLVGPPGCGKSTFSNKLNEKTNCVIISPDKIRGELTGDEGDQTNNNAVFRVVYSRLIEHLDNGDNVIYDATNCRSNYRIKIIDLVKGHAKHTVCIVFTTRLNDCINQNNLRNRIVPEDVIERMYVSLRNHPPTTFEGYDIIINHAALDCFKEVNNA